MKTNELAKITTLSIAALAWAAASSACTRDMMVGGALDQQGQGQGGSAGADAGTFACGSQTCVAGHDFCLMGPVDPGHCVPLPQACAGTSSCGCVCQTQGGGPGTCPDPAQFNDGQGECSCQNFGATSNVAVWCSLPPAPDAGSATFPCGTKTCTVGSEICVMGPTASNCVEMPTDCTGNPATATCQCACQTPSDSPGSCPSPGRFNYGLQQCSCPTAGATTNAVVYCQ
jgi:hypothetical protein